MRLEPAIEQLHIEVEGIVQGVGFRPFVYRIATGMGLMGTVQNQGRCVLIVLEGTRERLGRFVEALRGNLPAQARIERLAEEWRTAIGFRDFQIIDSALDGEIDLAIPADLATCADCWHEFENPADRRHLYPFTTCVACGPRYTVIEEMPYDRCRTTLRLFPLCDACRAEYEDPANRRFHAESTACPRCGPALALYDESFTQIAADPREIPALVRASLARGGVVALRGLGGYLLCCDALCGEAVALLRQRKKREHQPFAVMARNIELVRRHFVAGPDEERLLQSPRGPIMILETRLHSPLDLSLIAPDTRDVGIMLPTTPLHWLLFYDDAPERPLFDFLIMTSGNAHGEPICRDDQEARERLTGLYDLVLTHNRDIARVCDDSLYHASAGRQRVLRRARGLAPDKVDLPGTLGATVLAMGGDLKNTLALGYGSKAILSPHIGDLNYLATHKAYRRLTEELIRFFAKAPQRVAIDLHPDYVSTAWGRGYAAAHGLELFEVQHHHAHAVSCLTEHGRVEGLALVFDGSGFGSDATIWGGEFLHARADGSFLRLGALLPTPLVGGEAAILHPMRLAIARLAGMGVDAHDSLYSRLGFDPREVKLSCSAAAMDEGGVMTSSAGRLFDVAAALVGLVHGKITYEGQAAIRLEALARTAFGAQSGSLAEAVAALPFYEFALVTQGETLWADSDPVLRGIVDDLLAGQPRDRIALKFHLALAHLAQHFVRDGQARTGCRTVALSGGVMQNRLLVDLLFMLLEGDGLEVLAHRLVPAGDGGIALGQLWLAGNHVV